MGEPDATQIAESTRGLQDSLDSLSGAADRCERLESEVAKLRSGAAATKADTAALAAARRDLSRFEAENTEMVRRHYHYHALILDP